ncbi:hypothetical protein [Frankia sp. Cppng1_Ct_nod]|uniref:hypothetical protein n=1 Tax=Frankia sp. Cppng1_Ct_nod TaxID=2897162 RepID=UPI001041077F|nr:hypothetical protein [Frankia sp. Cppng1_Ct_nod]
MFSAARFAGRALLTAFAVSAPRRTPTASSRSDGCGGSILISPGWISPRLAPARLGSARLGSARLGTAVELARSVRPA